VRLRGQDTQVLRGKTLSEQVYDLLERRIVKGVLSPGSHIAEEKIARELGISRSPVRHALGALERRGLAEWAGKRDRRVSIPSTSFVADVFDTCTVLESGRIYHSCRYASVDDHLELRTCVERMKTLRKRRRNKEYEKSLIGLREIMVRRCNNEKLNQLSREFEIFRKWIITISYPSSLDLYHAEQEHWNIVECYIKKDRAGLMEAMEAHASHQKESTIAAYEQQLALSKTKGLPFARLKRSIQDGATLTT
jgi:DNA-binding GntR family transcriptional regulator